MQQIEQVLKIGVLVLCEDLVVKTVGKIAAVQVLAIARKARLQIHPLGFGDPVHGLHGHVQKRLTMRQQVLDGFHGTRALRAQGLPEPGPRWGWSKRFCHGSTPLLA